MSSSLNGDLEMFDKIIAELMELRKSLQELENVTGMPSFPLENKRSTNIAAIKEHPCTLPTAQLPTHKEIQRLKWMEQVLKVLFEFPKPNDFYRPCHH